MRTIRQLSFFNHIIQQQISAIDINLVEDFPATLFAHLRLYANGYEISRFYIDTDKILSVTKVGILKLISKYDITGTTGTTGTTFPDISRCGNSKPFSG